MDRLVFGDVGFGKTEMAIRAAAMLAVRGGRWSPCGRRLRFCKAALEGLQKKTGPANALEL